MATICVNGKATEHTVFVYDTLRKGFHNNNLLDNTRFVCKAKTADKYTMRVLGTVPFVDKNTKSIVITGEVYIVSDEVLANLDMLEAHPNWYNREAVQIEVDDNTFQEAWVYFNSGKGTVIPSGDYVDCVASLLE